MSKIIGLTGGIGSGKSKILLAFEALGDPCYNSDIKAKKIMEDNLEAKNSIIDLIGPDSYYNNKLNSSYISSKVFNDNKLLNSLNKIIHPKINSDFTSWIKFQNKPFVVIETAVLFESGLNFKCDKIIIVNAPLGLRLKRIIKRDKIKKNEIMKRINNQINFENKINESDFFINNTDWDETLIEVNRIFNILKKK